MVDWIIVGWIITSIVFSLCVCPCPAVLPLCPVRFDHQHVTPVIGAKAFLLPAQQHCDAPVVAIFESWRILAQVLVSAIICDPFFTGCLCARPLSPRTAPASTTFLIYIYILPPSRGRAGITCACCTAAFFLLHTEGNYRRADRGVAYMAHVACTCCEDVAKWPWSPCLDSDVF